MRYKLVVLTTEQQYQRHSTAKEIYSTNSSRQNSMHYFRKFRYSSCSAFKILAV